MNSDPRRKPLRLPVFDYSQPSAYFVTTVVAGRACLFGEIVDGEVRLNSAGIAVASAWRSLSARFTCVEPGEFVVMPNHFHGIVWLIDPAAAVDQGAASSAPTGRVAGLGEVMRAFKSLSTREVNGASGTSGALWQRNYFERVVRNEEHLAVIREYIADNPRRWVMDRENPAAVE